MPLVSNISIINWMLKSPFNRCKKELLNDLSSIIKQVRMVQSFPQEVSSNGGFLVPLTKRKMEYSKHFRVFLENKNVLTR